MNKNNDILIVAEIINGILNPATYELISKARELSDITGCNANLVLVGDDVKGFAEKLSFYDIDKLYYVNSESFKNFAPDVFSTALEGVIDTLSPKTVLFADSSIACDYAAMLCAKIDCGIISKCSDLFAVDGEIIAQRKSFGGHMTANLSCDSTELVVVIPGCFSKAVPCEKQCEIEEMFVKLPEPRQSLLRIDELGNERMGLIDSKIIVSGGRGLQDKSGFEMIEELSNLLGGVVGASRGAVDLDWIDYSHQVGQTSAIVHPDLYIACGISGAIQHQAGMKDSGYIVAINKDRNAHIFEICDFGIVGDLHQVIPEIIDILKNKN